MGLSVSLRKESWQATSGVPGPAASVRCGGPAHPGKPHLLHCHPAGCRVAFQPMSPQVRQALTALLAVVLAVWMGFEIADGALGWPTLFTGIALAAMLSRLLALPLDVIVVGLVVAGYIVGNRGFAQQTPIPNLPLLPAEIALGIATSWRLFVWGHQRRLPLGRTTLDWLVLAWIVAGGARFVFDFPRHGFLAVRDFAMIYYAVFFIIVRQMALAAPARRYLQRCLLFAVLVLPVSYGLSLLLPEFMQSILATRNAPLIFFKDDLAGTFFALGSVWLFFNLQGRWRSAGLLLAAGYAAFVLGRDNRASATGLIVAAGLLLAAGRWRYPALLGTMMGLGLAVLLGLAAIGHNSWAQDRVQGLGDRLRSITDFSGGASYNSQESRMKGDNNRFRLVWWQSVTEETIQAGPVFGLGFGHDLAGSFVREYYPENIDEFTARSPHNIHLTVFGRMGAVGLLIWGSLCAVLLRRTWQSLRRTEEPEAWAYWCGAWILLTSATFGVVLEGPMGAVVFWTLLGLASAIESRPAPPDDSTVVAQ